MADPLYLSLWFPSFTAIEMMPRLNSVLKQFPFSQARGGISYLSVHPVSWGEPTIIERRFRPGLDPEQTVAIANEFLHSDYAYVLEAYWDLFAPAEGRGGMDLSPQQVRVIAHGLDFGDALYKEAGHIQIDFGFDIPFLGDDDGFDEPDRRIRANVQKLIAFTQAVEKTCGISGRVLWSESDENLAQKLVAKLQKVN